MTGQCCLFIVEEQIHEYEQRNLRLFSGTNDIDVASREFGNEVYIFNTTYDYGFLERDPESAFDKIRCYLNKIDHAVTKSTSVFSSSVLQRFSEIDFERWRADIQKYFNFVLRFLRHVEESATKRCSLDRFLRKISSELRGLLLDIGFVHKYFLNDKVKVNAHFHICWDVRRYALKIINIVMKNWPHLADCFNFVAESSTPKLSAPLPSTSLLNYIYLQIFDMFAIMLLFYKQEHMISDDIKHLPCAGIESYWIILKQFVNQLPASGREIPSFSLITKNFMEKNFNDRSVVDIQDVESNAIPLTCRLDDIDPAVDIGEFFWMALIHIKNVEMRFPTENDRSTAPDDTIVVDFLLKTTVVDVLLNELQYPRLTAELEAKTRRYLACYLQLLSANAGKASTNAILDLTDAFCKRLNDAFYVGPTLDDFITRSNDGTIGDLFRDVVLYCSVSSESVRNKFSSSFSLFLNIVGIHCCEPRTAKIVRSRIFSKFHVDRVLNLSERGLTKFFELLFVLGKASGEEDCRIVKFLPYFLNVFALRLGVREVAERLIDFIAHFDIRKTGLSKTKLGTKSFAFLALMFIESQQDASLCIGKLKQLFNLLLERYIAVRYDLSVRRDLFELIICIIGYCSEILDWPDKLLLADSNLDTLSCILLIDLHLDRILQDAKEDVKPSHLKIMLDFYNRILRRILTTLELLSNNTTPHLGNKIKMISDLIHSNALSTCKKVTIFLFEMGETWHGLPDLWYHLTLTLHFKNCESKKSGVPLFNELFDFVTWNKNFDGFQVCRYVGLLISTTYLMDSLLVDYVVVQSWLRCLFTTQCESMGFETIKSVTEFIFKENYLPITASFDSIDLLNTNKPFDFSIKIFRYLCDQIALLESTIDRESITQLLLYFEKPIRFCVEALKNWCCFADDSPKERVSVHLMTCFSYLIEKCAGLLHKRDDPKSLMKAIIDQTVLFNTKITDVSERRARYEAVNAIIPPVIKGLLKISGWLYDSFLKNVFCDAYRLSLQRLCLLACDKMENNNRRYKQNFGFIFATVQETFSLDFDEFGDRALLRKYCLRKAICDCFDRLTNSFNDTSPKSSGSVAASVNILLDFVVQLCESTKRRCFITEECLEFLPRCLTSWIRCNDDSLSTVFFDAAVCLLHILSAEKSPEENLKNCVKQALSANLYLYADRTIKVFRQLNRDTVFKSNIKMNDLYSKTLMELEETRKSVNPKLQ